MKGEIARDQRIVVVHIVGHGFAVHRNDDSVCYSKNVKHEPSLRPDLSRCDTHRRDCRRSFAFNDATGQWATLLKTHSNSIPGRNFERALLKADAESGVSLRTDFDFNLDLDICVVVLARESPVLAIVGERAF